MSKKIHRFFIDIPLALGEISIRDEALVNQIVKVLKLRSEEPIALFNSSNQEAVGTITGVSKIAVTIEITSLEVKTENVRKVHLYAAILKKENFEYGIQKAVEVGVSSITPLLSERTVKTGLKIDRLEKIITEAAELCGRTIVPELTDTLSYTDALQEAIKNGVVLVCDSSGVPYKEVLKNTSGPISVFVGPEGGFSDSELEIARSMGAIITGMGKFTMRGETALTVASFLCVNE